MRNTHPVHLILLTMFDEEYNEARQHVIFSILPLLPLFRVQIFPQHLALKHPQFMFFPWDGGPNFMPIRAKFIFRNETAIFTF